MHKRGEGDGVSRIWHGGSSMSGCWSIPSRASQHRPEMAETCHFPSLPMLLTASAAAASCDHIVSLPTYPPRPPRARSLPHRDIEQGPPEKEEDVL